MDNVGWLSLLPTVCVLIIAFKTKRIIEALLAGAVVGFIILNKGSFFSATVDSMLGVMGDPTVGWIALVIVFFGGFIALLVKSGGAQAFGNFVSSKVKTKKATLLSTWFLGLLIFVDDYLNALTLGTAMKKVTDKKRTSREYLAYIIDSTAAPVCVLVPLSTWAVFASGLLETNGVAAEGMGGATYLQIVPFILYGWVAILVVLLSILGVIPKFGPMKKAEIRAETTGVCVPPGSAALDLVDDEFDSNEEGGTKPRLINFFIPIGVLIGYTWYADIDLLQGVIVAVIVTIAMMFIQKIMSLKDLLDTFIEGSKPMMFIIMMFIASFMLVDANDQLGLTEFVIEVSKPYMSGALLPVIAFVTLGLVAFATGAIWGIYAITFPIIIPLADAVGADVFLALGAVISAGAIGSHACPYGDSTILSSTASGIDPLTHVVTQMPYILLSGVISAAMFLILGFIM